MVTMFSALSASSEVSINFRVERRAGADLVRARGIGAVSSGCRSTARGATGFADRSGRGGVEAGVEENPGRWPRARELPAATRVAAVATKAMGGKSSQGS